MRWFSKIGFYVKTLFWRRRLDAQLSEEVRIHLEMATEANVAKGMTPEAARHVARREFGNVAGFQERTRDERGWVWLEQTLTDVRHAFRSLRKSPSFTAVAVLSLALGIGANIALFSLVDDVLLRSLPVQKPQELVLFRWLSNNAPFHGIWGPINRDPVTGLASNTALSFSIFEQLRDRSDSVLSDAFAFAPLDGLSIVIDRQPEVARGQFVTGGYFPGLDVAALRGRMLSADDDRANAAPAAVISYRFWHQRFGGEEAALGKVIRVNRIPVTIVGIAPRGFIGTLQAGEAPDLTLPMACEPQVRGDDSFLDRELIWWVHIMGRLKPGVHADQAQTQLEPILRQAARDAWNAGAATGPDKRIEDRDMPLLRLEPGGRGLVDIRRTYTQPLAILSSLVGLVLLIACANIANLLLARAATRRREIAVRLSVGASRGRIIRQLLTESLVLSLLGGALGLLVAYWGRDALLHLRPIGDSGSLSLDPRILAFAFGLSVCTGLISGLAPARQASRVDLIVALKGAARPSQSRSWFLLRSGLTVVQVMVAVVLLTCAGMFLGTLHNLRSVNAGFNRENLLVFVASKDARNDRDASEAELFDRMRARIQALPGVRSAAFSNYALLSGHSSRSRILLNNPRLPVSMKTSAAINGVSPGFMRTMEIPLLLGRDLTASDTAGRPQVALVNETFARTYFPEETAVGRSFVFPGRAAVRSQDRMVEIVGVVRDALYADLRGEIAPTVYPAFSQEASRGGHFAVRTAGDLQALASTIRTAVHEIDPDMLISDLRTQEQQVSRLVSQERLFAMLAAFFGLLALVLVCIGLYGLMSHAVLQRTNEIGVRMAVGALPRTVFWMVLRESLTLVAIGIVVGLAAAAVAVHSVSALLFRLSPTDPVTYGAVTLLLIATALLAAWLPARRATKVDPMTALRAE